MLTREEVLHWLYAIETVANDAGEAGEWSLQDDCLEWYQAVRDGFLWAVSPFNGLHRTP